MKAKTFTKHTVSLVFSLIMMFVIFSVGFSVFAVEAADCEHRFLDDDKWVVTSPATCQMSGWEEQYCVNCHTTVKREIPLDENAHMMGAWETVVPHTCEHSGVETRRCELCKKPETEVERIIPAHDFNTLFSEEATCVKDGYVFKVCLTCYTMITETIPADGVSHNYSDWVITENASCVNESGTRTRTCLNRREDGSLCGDVQTEKYSDPQNHTNIVWEESNRVNPTCEISGYKIGKCEGCEAEIKMDLPRHSQVAQEDIIVLLHTDSTCHTQGKELRRCICGYQYEVVLPLDENNHEYGEWYIEKKPCGEKGVRAKYCNYHIQQRVAEEIPATGEHVYGDWEIEVEPDCSKTGVKVKTCTICGEAKIRENLPTLHVYTTWSESVKMECKEGFAQNGVRVAECNKCNQTKEFIVPALHSFGVWIITDMADCKTGKVGMMQRTCSKCGKAETKEYTTEHDFTIWVVKEAPGCADNTHTGKTGTEIRWCKNCKYQQSRVIPADHAYDEWEIVRYPDCSKVGDDKFGLKVAVCKYCGYEAEEEINPEHVYGEWTVTRNEDCTGTKTAECFNCGHKETVSLAKEHTYGDWVWSSEIYDCGSGEAATQTVPLIRTCTKCSVSETKTEIPGYNGHPNLKTVVIKPSCTVSGYTMDYCPDCNYEKIYNVVPATGHEYSAEWKDMLAPTCTSKGSRYRDCANCDYLDYVEIEKTNHMLITINPGYEATCTTEGLSAESYCAVCKEVFESKVIPAKGHNYGDGEICVDCKAYKESKDCSCSCHSTSGMEKIIFEIINKLYQLVGINQQCKCGVLHYEEAGFLAKLFGKA